MNPEPIHPESLHPWAFTLQRWLTSEYVALAYLVLFSALLTWAVVMGLRQLRPDERHQWWVRAILDLVYLMWGVSALLAVLTWLNAGGAQ